MVTKLDNNEINSKIKDLDAGWVIERGRLKREYDFPDFKSALDLANKIGIIAEKVNHHPNICLGWGDVVVEIQTHEVEGITDKDFELASLVDELGS